MAAYGLSSNNPWLQGLGAMQKSGGEFADPSGYQQMLQTAQDWENAQKEKADADASAAATAAAVTPPKTDPGYTKIAQAQVDTATNFKNNIPQLATTLMDQAAQNQKQILSSAIANTNSNYNARGLLYSTARQGAVQSDKNQSAAELQQTRSGINQELENTSNSLNQDAINTGFNIAGANAAEAAGSTELSNAYANAALGNQAQQQQAISGLATGLGSGVGYLGGYLANQPSSNTGAPTSSQIGGVQMPNVTFGQSAPGGSAYMPASSGMGLMSMAR